MAFASTIEKIISHARIIYGPDSTDYAEVLIQYKNALAGSPRTFVDKEILRLKGPEGLVSKSLYSRDQLLGTINTLINLDAGSVGFRSIFSIVLCDDKAI